MVRNQTTSELGPDLLLELTGAGRRAGLLTALREAVASGRLTPGTPLPSSRVLARDLGISRSTVTECYGELVAEGWLVASQGSGTRVAPRIPALASKRPEASRRSADGLAPGSVEFAEFPRVEWLAAARRALSTAPHAAFGYGDAAGNFTLRAALADYLARARGVRADPERIVISAGFHHGLGLVANALRDAGIRRVAVEEYGLGLYREVLSVAGMVLPAVRVDELGARVAELTDLHAESVLLTPAHQFPTGYALSADRRVAALEWARSAHRFVLEDDYDGEFRFDRKPIGALQGLDPDRVVYFGTASKSIAPALRLGWIVVPAELLPAVLAAKGSVETVSVLDQLTLAEFITSGAFDRHVRSRRQGYRRRREQLAAALAEHAPHVHLSGMQAGLQALLELPAGTEAATVRAAAARGLTVSGLAEFHHEARSTRDALVVNYSAVSESAWPAVLEALCAVLPR